MTYEESKISTFKEMCERADGLSLAQLQDLLAILTSMQKRIQQEIVKRNSR